MGANSHKCEVDSSVGREPSRASRSGGFFVVRSQRLVQKHPGASRNGRPGSRGSRRERRVPKHAGPAGRERGDEPDTDGRANHRMGSQTAARFRAPRQNLFVRDLVCRISRLTDAGGEDFGYFAPGKAGSNPAFGVTYRGGSPGGPLKSRAAVLSFAREPALTSLKADFACSPAYPSIAGALRRQGGGEDVCYFV